MNAFKNLFLANWREFARDRTALFFTFIFPLLFIVIFGLAFGGKQSIEAKVGLVNADQGMVGNTIVEQLEAVTTPSASEDEKNPLEKLEFISGTEEDLQAQLKAGDINALVVIPAGTSELIAQSQQAAIQLYTDETSQVVAPVLQGVVGGVVDGIDRQIVQAPPMLSVDMRSVLSASLRYIDVLVPGILAMSLMQLGLFATAQPMIAMRTQGILRRLGATPLPRSILLLAYIALRLLLALLQTAIIVVVALLLFDVQITGSILVLVASLLVGAGMFIAIGFFVAAVARTEESGNALTNLINFPMLFLSGVFFPVSGLPGWLRPVIDLLPLTYTADSIKQAMISAPPVHSQFTNFAVQLGWLVVMSLLSIRFFRWESR